MSAAKNLVIDVSHLGEVPGNEPARVTPYHAHLLSRRLGGGLGAVAALVATMRVGNDDAERFGGARMYTGADADRFGGYDMGEDDMGGDYDMGDDAVDAILQGRRRGRNKPKGLLFDQILAFEDLAIIASGTDTAQTFPQRAFIPQRLTIVSTIAQNWKVNDVRVGQETQFVSTGTVYAETFSEVATYTRLKGTMARVGNYIAVEVTNRDAANTHTFNCSIIGLTKEG